MVADRITLELVIQIAGENERGVGVRLPRGARVDVLLEALQQRFGLPPGGALYLSRTGRWLSATEAIEEIPLLRGDILWLGDGSVEPPVRPGRESSPLELVVVGGPAMGVRHALSGDAITIGRARDSDVTIDDPALSRKHLMVELADDEVCVSDAGSTNGTYMNGVPLEAHHRWVPGQVIEAGASLLSIERRHPRDRAVEASSAGALAFNRPPRVRSRPVVTSFEIPAPPQENERPRVPLIAAGVPLLLALIMWQVFPGNPAFLVLLTLSPLVALFSYFDDRRRGTKTAGLKESEWRRAVEGLSEEIETARAAMAQRVRDAAPGAAELEQRAADIAPSLWLRRPEDDDFLTIRYGWGDRPWKLDLRYQPGGSARLRAQVEERLAAMKVLPSVPLTVSLRDAPVIGLAGDAPAVEDAVRWWVAQLCVLHSPEDLRLVVASPSDDEGPAAWLRWLPHAVEMQGVPLDDLLATLANSIEAAAASGNADGRHRETVVFIHERAQVPRAVVGRLLRNGHSAGIRVVWVGSDPDKLPGESRVVIEVTSDPVEAVLTDTADGSEQRGAAEGTDAQSLRRIALALAPVVDASGAFRTTGLPHGVTLFEMLDDATSARGVERRWEAPPPGLEATAGVSSEGPFVIDLVSDGPHALIGGMTGSGKSELLQTLVASLAAAYPPSRLNLLLIDYKGGAAFADCVELPHAVGFVTDLDASTSRRALTSLNAEVRRREMELRAKGIADIVELERSPGPFVMPRLVIVIDEFATLVKELPGFVEGIVDIAQRGRSLGLHLVLATQRPAGVINDAIRANTNLRVCLRVADEADSVDVIGDSAAGRIPRSLPGRAYFRTGPGELVEVQVAQASAPAGDGDAVQVWDLDGTRYPDDEGGATGIAQLGSVIAAVRAAGTTYPPQRSPWLPPLPDVVTIDALRARSEGPVIGLMDEPHLQRQEPVVLDLPAHGGIVAYGTGQAGKTTILMTIAASLAATASVEEVHIYGIDMTSGPLRAIEALPHCGDVVAGNDAERVRRLLFMLLREIDARKTGDPNAARPAILVLIDGYAAFTSAYERIDLGELVDLIPRLISDGRGVGIHFVVSAERRAAVPGAVSSLLPRKVVLRLGDPDDYSVFGLSPRELAEMTLPPGRGFIDGMLFQAAVVSERFDPDAVRAGLQQLAPAPASGTTRSAARVQGLPTAIPLDEIPPAADPLVAAFGLRETDLASATADLRHGHVLIAGPYRSGRSTALTAIAAGIRRTTPAAELHLLTPRPAGVSEDGIWTGVARGLDACVEAVARVLGSDAGAPVVLFIDDADDVPDGPLSDELQSLVKQSRAGSLRIVAAVEARALHRTFGGWLAELRKDKQGLLLEPDLEIDGDLLGVRLPRRSVRFRTGRGYMVSRGDIELVQVALP